MEGFNSRLEQAEESANKKTGHWKLFSQRSKKEKYNEKELRELKGLMGHHM